MRRVRWAFLPLLLGACVPYPGQAPQYESRLDAVTQGPFQPLDPGSSELDSLHFSVRAYGSEASRKVADLAEAAYNRIMVDANLYSFRPRELYRIVVYATQDEFRKKTQQPDWSGGVSVGNAIYTFQGPHLPAILSHEMTHLVFYEYMGRSEQNLRWINEGLAVFEQAQAEAGPRGAKDPFAGLRAQISQRPLPVDQLLTFVPASEAEYQVNAWYAQSYSMVRFMLERGGRVGFSQFLSSVKAGRSFDEAVSTGFPGNWRSLSDLEAEWQRGL